MIFVSIVIWVSLFTFLIYRRIKSRRYLEHSTKETMRHPLRHELEKEQAAHLRKEQLFKEALARAMKRSR